MAEQCKEIVGRGSGIKGSVGQCSRPAVKDGYCKQHHPDAVAARRAEKRARRSAQKRWPNGYGVARPA